MDPRTLYHLRKDPQKLCLQLRQMGQQKPQPMHHHQQMVRRRPFHLRKDLRQMPPLLQTDRQKLFRLQKGHQLMRPLERLQY